MTYILSRDLGKIDDSIMLEVVKDINNTNYLKIDFRSSTNKEKQVHFKDLHGNHVRFTEYVSQNSKLCLLHQKDVQFFHNDGCVLYDLDQSDVPVTLGQFITMNPARHISVCHQISIGLLTSVLEVHKSGVVLNAVFPDNFLLYQNQMEVGIGCFSYATSCEDKRIVTVAPGSDVCTTSLNLMKSYRTHIKDDIEGLVYLLMAIYGFDYPWSNEMSVSQIKKQKKSLKEGKFELEMFKFNNFLQAITCTMVARGLEPAIKLLENKLSQDGIQVEAPRDARVTTNSVSSISSEIILLQERQQGGQKDTSVLDFSARSEDGVTGDNREDGFLAEQRQFVGHSAELQGLRESADEEEEDDEVLQERVSSGGWFSSLESLVGNKKNTSEDIEPLLEKMKENLILKNVASEPADKICQSVGRKLEGKVIGTFTRINSEVKEAVRQSLSQNVEPEEESLTISFDSLTHNDRITGLGPASPEVRKAAQEFLTFLNKSVTPFHAVAECSARLRSAGFEELVEGAQWELKPLQKYFVTKNGSAIMAFAVGGAYQPGNGFSIVVGHTDSPCLRVKPIFKQDKFLQVGVSTYGGGIWRTWFDRDLSVAGQIVVKEGDFLTRKLVDIEKPIVCIPNLAIHLETDRNKFECNTETQLRPILETFVAAGLNGAPKKGSKEAEEDSGSEVDPRSVTPHHHSQFIDLVSSAANANKDDIVDMDLYLYDTNKAQITGLHDEFISGARLDNLVGTYTAISGLIASLDDQSFATDPSVRMAACFDKKEVGSESQMGASSVTEWILRKLADGGHSTAFEEAIEKSMLISADQTHAAHPNYGAKHEENHRPSFHGGVVVKINVNQRYATTSTTHAVLKQVAFEAGVPLQQFVVRNDSPCGSTVGPILSSKLGLATIDVGCPQLAMHSIREFADTSSIHLATTLYSKFFNRMTSILASMKNS